MEHLILLQLQWLEEQLLHEINKSQSSNNAQNIQNSSHKHSAGSPLQFPLAIHTLCSIPDRKNPLSQL